MMILAVLVGILIAPTSSSPVDIITPRPMSEYQWPAAVNNSASGIPAVCYLEIGRSDGPVLRPADFRPSEIQCYLHPLSTTLGVYVSSDSGLAVVQVTRRQTILKLDGAHVRAIAYRMLNGDGYGSRVVTVRIFFHPPPKGTPW